MQISVHSYSSQVSKVLVSQTRNYYICQVCNVYGGEDCHLLTIIFICRWLTTANGYMRLLLFGKAMTQVQKAKLLRLVSYAVSVYVPMFLRVHLNPRAPEGPSNMLFLRDLLLDYHQKDEMLVDHSLKKVFIKHFCSWMNPVNVTLNVFSKNPAYQVKHLEDPQQNLSDEVDTQQLAWKRMPLKSYFSSRSKVAPCLEIPSKKFWNSVDNHNRSCERFIGHMSRCLTAKKVRDFKTSQEKNRTDMKIRGYISHGSMQ